MKFRKAFTLIELLVVIAIIGILAAMILVALNTARQKSKNARVKSALTQARTEAQIFYSSNPLTTACTPANGVFSQSLIDEARAQGGNATLTCTSSLAAPASIAGWYVHAYGTTLNEEMCMDSKGNVGKSQATAGFWCDTQTPTL